MQLAEKIATVTEFLRQSWTARPRAGIILGTGLGQCAQGMQVELSLPYGEIPHFVPTTALGHKGQLLCGTLAGSPVVVLQGRFHLYEGHSRQLATFPVRVMHALGIETLIVTNASGGLNPSYGEADIMLIDDHIDLMRTCQTRHDTRVVPGAWPKLLEFAWRETVCDRVYDTSLIELALRGARKHRFACHRGVYAAMSGPNYETRAEYRWLRRIGADVVGMSTVPEALVAAECGLRTLGVSVVTNLCRPDTLHATGGEQVQAVAEMAEARVRQLLEFVLQ